jgi:hypothetical protein
MTTEPDSTNSLRHPADTAKIPAENAVSITPFSWWPRTLKGSVVVIALLCAALWQSEHRLYGVALAFFLISGSRYLWFSVTVPADRRPNIKWWRTPGAVAASVCVVLALSAPPGYNGGSVVGDGTVPSNYQSPTENSALSVSEEPPTKRLDHMLAPKPLAPFRAPEAQDVTAKSASDTNIEDVLNGSMHLDDGMIASLPPVALDEFHWRPNQSFPPSL